MKNIIYIVCLVLFLVSSINAREVSQLEERDGVMYEPNKEEPFTGKLIIYYENGQKKGEGNYKEGKQDGLWTWWDENGKKKREGNYKEGKLDGLWTHWYENGQKKSEGTVKEGKLDGLRTEWDENGHVTKMETYRNGELVE